MKDIELIEAYNEWVFESGEAPSYEGFLAWKEQNERKKTYFRSIDSGFHAK